MSNDESQARIEAIGDQLRAKISSKFQTSTFLAGFGLAVLTLQVSTFWQAQRCPYLLPVSISIMVVSICIYIAALVRLDELTMPKRFWKHASNQSETETTLAYLKGNDLWELQKRMVFYWWCLTAVATSLTGASLLLMLLPLAPRELPDHKTSEILVIVRHIFGWTLVGVIVLLIYFAILGLIVRWFKRKGFGMNWD